MQGTTNTERMGEHTKFDHRPDRADQARQSAERRKARRDSRRRAERFRFEDERRGVDQMARRHGLTAED